MPVSLPWRGNSCPLYFDRGWRRGAKKERAGEAIWATTRESMPVAIVALCKTLRARPAAQLQDELEIVSIVKNLCFFLIFWGMAARRRLPSCQFRGKVMLLWILSTAKYRGSGWAAPALGSRLALGAAASIFFESHQTRQCIGGFVLFRVFQGHRSLARLQERQQIRQLRRRQQLVVAGRHH
jgi:hypothetical protein